jgi:hypothetical protein
MLDFGRKSVKGKKIFAKNYAFRTISIQKIFRQGVVMPIPVNEAAEAAVSLMLEHPSASEPSLQPDFARRAA